MLDNVGQCWIMLDETHASIQPCQRSLDTESDKGRRAAGAVRSATFHLRLLCFIEIVASSHAPTAYVTFTFEISKCHFLTWNTTTKCVSNWYFIWLFI